MKVHYTLKSSEDVNRVALGGIDLTNTITVTIEGTPTDVDKVIVSLKKEWLLE